MMEDGIPNASLHSMNGQNRHNIRRVAVRNDVRQQVRDYKRSHKQSGLVSRMVDAAIGYELIGSVAAIAVLGAVITVALR